MVLMRGLLRYVFILALSLGCTGLSSAANSQTKNPKKPVTGSVSGRVTLHGKGAAGIIVGVRNTDFSAQPLPAIKATTDSEGNYRITGIPAGSYQVSPMAPAYVVTDLVAARARGRTLLLSEGEDVQEVDFSLERGGVIAGRVTDAAGRPVVEEQLTLVTADQNKQNQQMLGPGLGSGAQTDDRGVYRIYGLVPGQYKISVGRDNDTYYSTTGVGRVAYKRTFYPDATDPAQAKVIEVTEGSEATDIDITLGQALPGFVASGRVVDGETGRPVSLRLGLRRVLNNDYAGINASVSANSQGEFRLENITPGKYVVLILPVQGIEMRADPVSFDVVDQDVNGLLVKTFKGLSVSGNVIIEGKPDSSLAAKLAELRLYAYVRNEGASPGFGHSSPFNADGSFRIGGLSPGTANFTLGSQEGRPLVNFSISRVERDGVVQPRGLELNSGEPQVTGVKIFLSYGTGSVRGEVKMENGPLPVGGRVMVSLKKLGEAESNFRSYIPDLRGHFLIEGVSAGEYEVRVQANVPRREPPSAKQQITVSEGAVSDVVITVDLKPKPGQPMSP
jgi:protocatechuate 3,4-dioxygenase beta subunit